MRNGTQWPASLFTRRVCTAPVMSAIVRDIGREDIAGMHGLFHSLIYDKAQLHYFPMRLLLGRRTGLAYCYGSTQQYSSITILSPLMTS